MTRTPSAAQLAAVRRLSDADLRLNIESRLLAELTKYGGERIVAGPPMDRLIKDLADATEQLAAEGFLRGPGDLAEENS